MYLNPHWMTSFIYSGNISWMLIKGETLTTLSRGRALDSLGKSSGAGSIRSGLLNMSKIGILRGKIKLRAALTSQKKKKIKRSYE